MPTETQKSGPAYRIRTRRLVLRCWAPADAPLLQTAIDASLAHLRPWMAWTRHEPEAVDAKVARLRQWRAAFDLDEDYVYGIFDAAEDAVLGGSGLHTRRGPDTREIGYWIHADHVNRGLATEATGALTRVAFEVEGVQRVEIRCDPRNGASAAVPRKLGFTHDATLRRRFKTADGTWRDVMVWSLLADEYRGSPASAAEIEAYDALGRQIL
jgi:RimJ/RimL family protein N-acetyltransferase